MEGILQRFLLGKDCSSLRKCCIKEIERVASPIARDEFLLKYVIPNVPCILEPWATKEWPSIKDWVENGTNRINRRILNDKFGRSTCHFDYISIWNHHTNFPKDNLIVKAIVMITIYLRFL